MAVKPFVHVQSKAIRSGDLFGYWELENGDTAAPLIAPRFSDKSCHMFAPTDGAWGGSTVTLKQSNDPDMNVVWTSQAPDGTEISQTQDTDAGKAILVNSYILQPAISGGAGSKVRIAIVGRGEK